MATVKTVLVKGRSNRSGKFPLVVQVLHKRRKKVVYTGVSIPDNLFDPVRGRVIIGGENTPETVRRINHRCESISRILLKSISIMEKESREYEIEDVFRTYSVLTRETGFYSYFSRKILELRQSGHEGTARAYASSLRSMQRYLGKKDFPFIKLSSRIIADYHGKLLASGICDNTIGFYLHNIKALFRKGCREMGLELPCPFREISIKTEKTLKRSLDTGVIRTLSGMELEKNSPLSLARDIFMFSFYTRGMSFVDIALLKKKNVFPAEICYKRHKTDQLMRVGINREINRILERYKNVPGEYMFPLFTEKEEPYTGYRNAYHKIRYSLRKISRSIGLETPLRLHAARHSWATIAKESGASIHIIGECLGHTSEKTTRIYLKELDHSALDAVNNQVANFIQSQARQ
ncbi:tyrosine-type recombinase/integrase [Bacteroides sp. AN502(2024)]|uniref:tyrosine-type recombinase/integrase n=1 Tax=Bacteroides sp. AN502(2024) TaxID=3160599 RepID=UPI0035166F41